MGHRLSKIATRTGDSGTTGLADGSRVDKHCPRIEAMGDVDELNSVIGLALAEPLPEAVAECLLEIQHDLFDLGGELSMPGHNLIETDHIARLDQYLERCNADLPALKEFILPGGNRAAGCCHLARTVCRRAERRLVQLGHGENVNPNLQIYLNRLSDLLFVLARIAARAGGGSEVFWRQRR